jgi:hypothetical protein
MKKVFTLLVAFVAFSFITTQAQTKQKKTQDFSVERIIDSPYSDVWKVVGEQYGEIANSHPGVVASNYEGAQSEGGEGCGRICYINEDSTKYTTEKQVNFDEVNYSFDVQISHVEKIPLDAEYSVASYQVIALSPTTSKIIIGFKLRTKPAFMGPLAKSKFKSTMTDYTIAIEHNVLTGEHVTKENFPEIKARYSTK